MVNLEIKVDKNVWASNKSIFKFINKSFTFNFKIQIQKLKTPGNNKHNTCMKTFKINKNILQVQSTWCWIPDQHDLTILANTSYVFQILITSVLSL